MSQSETRPRDMELRLLESQAERDTFRAAMLEARASRGGKFRETARSKVSEIQLTFARLYGVFNEANPNQLLGGFSIHCLNEFSQSFPIPNLSHLEPSGVYEAGQLWALTHEAFSAVRQGICILLGLFQAQTLLIYPLIIPHDITLLYRMFKRVGPPFELPFAETLKGEKVYMQAMLLEGDDLRRQVGQASHDGFETRRGHALVKFHLYHSAIITNPARVSIAKVRPLGNGDRWVGRQFGEEPNRGDRADFLALENPARAALPDPETEVVSPTGTTSTARRRRILPYPAGG